MPTRIDLRSDTVTKPDAGMRRAMYEAEVGDDVFGEDPTVRNLQEHVANLLGKEAALFVPSGTMGNQIALKVHTQPGDEVIIERTNHLFNYESGAPGLLSGIQMHILDGERGVLTADQVAAAIRPGYYWEAQTRLVWLENTLNKAGGVVYPRLNIEAIAGVARSHDLGLHLDGARLWNAAIASGDTEAMLAQPFDTVNVCLSKGLGAPVGSVLAGSQAHIEQAHRYRKLFGGGMRQVGILAAAGLYALNNNRAKLAEDHAKARQLAEGIANLSAFQIDLDTVATNIVIFHTLNSDALTVLKALQTEGVLMVPFGPQTIRATTHLDVSFDDITTVLTVLYKLFS